MEGVRPEMLKDLEKLNRREKINMVKFDLR